MELVDNIVSEIRDKNCYLIGIVGVPGSGKSHYSQILKNKLGNAMIVPMDGFHLYRKDLTQEGIRFRGAAFTFDLKSFKDKVEILSKRQVFPLKFPSFDHALKDPIEDSIIIQQGIQHIIVEGLYIFDKNVNLDCWDYKIWIETEIDIAMERLAKRHFQCGIQPTMEACLYRANNNDRKNGIYVKSHTNFQNCRKISNNIDKQ